MVPEEWLAAAAVEVAVCEEELFAVSPGSCKGTCELFDDEALIPDIPPPAAAVGVPPAEPVREDAGPTDLEPDGKVEVGTLSGSAPTPVGEPTPLWIVWAWAPVNPKTKAAISNIRRIANSRVLIPQGITRESRKPR
jgi:hypothetical protein